MLDLSSGLRVFVSSNKMQRNKLLCFLPRGKVSQCILGREGCGVKPGEEVTLAGVCVL